MRKKALSKTPMTVWRVLIYLFLFLFMAACLFPLLYELIHFQVEMVGKHQKPGIQKIVPGGNRQQNLVQQRK